MRFDASIALSDVASFTVCAVTRWPVTDPRLDGQGYARILTNGKTGTSWLMGQFYATQSGTEKPLMGVASFNVWVTQDPFDSIAGPSNPVASDATDWVVMCGTNAGSQLKLANGISVTTDIDGTGDKSLWVNGEHADTSDKSDFAIAEVVVWPRGLTDQEMHRVSQHLNSVYSGKIALADYAPEFDRTVGVHDGTREVFFKPVPNDGTRSHSSHGTSAFQISVMVPQSGKYQVGLTQRRGSDAFEDKAGSACRSSALSDRYASGKTDSFLICLLDPRSTATNPDPGTPDLSSCEEYHNGHSPKTFSFSDGANSLWLASREVCTLASKITITAVTITAV